MTTSLELNCWGCYIDFLKALEHEKVGQWNLAIVCVLEDNYYEGLTLAAITVAEGHTIMLIIDGGA